MFIRGHPWLNCIIPAEARAPYEPADALANWQCPDLKLAERGCVADQPQQGGWLRVGGTSWAAERADMAAAGASAHSRAPSD